MRIDFNTLKNIEHWYGSDDFEVGSSFEKDSITLRFGYWSEIDIVKLNSLLPYSLIAELNEVDDDEEATQDEEDASPAPPVARKNSMTRRPVVPPSSDDDSD